MKLSKRITALVVSLTILLTSLPMGAYGLEVGESLAESARGGDTALSSEGVYPEPKPDTAEEAEAEILWEIEEKRESDSKYYRMSDGSIKAAVYGPFRPFCGRPVRR